MDIPPDVNDTQLLLALKDHCDDNNSKSHNNHGSNNNPGDDSNKNNNGNGSTEAVNNNNLSITGSMYPIEIYGSAVVDGFCSSLAEGSDLDYLNVIHGGMSLSSINTGANASTTMGNSTMLYHRNAWAVFESEAAKVCVLLLYTLCLPYFVHLSLISNLMLFLLLLLPFYTYT